MADPSLNELHCEYSSFLDVDMNFDDLFSDSSIVPGTIDPSQTQSNHSSPFTSNLDNFDFSLPIPSVETFEHALDATPSPHPTTFAEPALIPSTATDQLRLLEARNAFVANSAPCNLPTEAPSNPTPYISSASSSPHLSSMTEPPLPLHHPSLPLNPGIMSVPPTPHLRPQPLWHPARAISLPPTADRPRPARPAAADIGPLPPGIRDRTPVFSRNGEYIGDAATHLRPRQARAGSKRAGVGPGAGAGVTSAPREKGTVTHGPQPPTGEGRAERRQGKGEERWRPYGTVGGGREGPREGGGEGYGVPWGGISTPVGNVAGGVGECGEAAMQRGAQSIDMASKLSVLRMDSKESGQVARNLARLLERTADAMDGTGTPEGEAKSTTAMLILLGVKKGAIDDLLKKDG